MSRDARRRFGHSLLGVVVLCAILVGAYALTVATYSRGEDWSCDDLPPTGFPCLHIEYGARP